MAGITHMVPAPTHLERPRGRHLFRMSGFTGQDGTEPFAGPGLAGFIQKPCELPGLRPAIQAALPWRK